MIKYIITTYPFLFIFTIISGVYTDEGCSAYGIRLALGQYFTHLQNSLDVIRISFNTKNNCSSRFYLTVQNINGFQKATNIFTTNLLNITEIYKDSSTKFKYETYVNTFKLGIHDLDLLKSFQNYSYVLVQDQKIEQGPFFFNIPQKYYTKEQKYVIFGDMDSNWIKNTSKPTFDWFGQQIAQKSDFDALLFMGDMAYDLQTKDYQYAEDWLRNISLFTQHYPFMITPGNHDSEQNHNYEFVRAVFQTLDLRQYDDVDFYNDFYSFDIGNAHFIQFNPVKLAYQEELEHTRENMLNIFRRDLELAQSNRENVPWIIVFTHYPLYCSGAQDVFCGRDFQSFKEFEYLFKEFHVDLYLAGHQHNYERDKPFFQNKSTDYEQQGDVISNYQVPIHIIEGAACNDYSMPSNIYPTQPYTEIQVLGCGVGILTIWNQTHLQFEHHYTINDSIADTIWLKKTFENPEDSDISAISIFFYCLGVIIILLTIFVILLIIRRRKQRRNSYPVFVEPIKD